MRTNKGIVFVIFISINLLVCSCSLEDPQCPTKVNGKLLSSEELKFIPYQKKDTIRYENTNGDILTFVCRNRDRYTSPNPPHTQDCPDNTAKGTIQNFYLEDYLQVTLLCLTNMNYDLNISMENNVGPNEGLIRVSFNSYDYITGELDEKSSCGVSNLDQYSDSVVCIGNYVINNQTYPNVFKLIKTTSYYDNTNTTFDSCYYNKPNGLLKFYLDGKAWSLK